MFDEVEAHLALDPNTFGNLPLGIADSQERLCDLPSDTNDGYSLVYGQHTPNCGEWAYGQHTSNCGEFDTRTPVLMGLGQQFNLNISVTVNVVVARLLYR